MQKRIFTSLFPIDGRLDGKWAKNGVPGFRRPHILPSYVEALRLSSHKTKIRESSFTGHVDQNRDEGGSNTDVLLNLCHRSLREPAVVCQGKKRICRKQASSCHELFRSIFAKTVAINKIEGSAVKRVSISISRMAAPEFPLQSALYQSQQEKGS